jgi:chromosome partitioning protein
MLRAKDCNFLAFRALTLLRVSMTCFVVFNQKGGVGKSTLATNLAAIAASKGKRVLLVDLDAQANSTRYVLGQDVAPVDSIAEFFNQSLKVSLYAKELNSFIKETPFSNLFILPSHQLLDELHDKLSAKHKIYKLREALSGLDIDEVWIDTPPVMNFYTLSALIAADECLVPYDGDRFSLEAASQVQAHIEEVKIDHHPKLRLLGAIMNGFQTRSKSMQEGVQKLAAIMPVFEPYLPYSQSVRSSRLMSKPLIYFDQAHKLSHSYTQLLNAIYEQSFSIH